MRRTVKREPKKITVSEAAREIDVPENTLRKWIRDGVFGNQEQIVKEKINRRESIVFTDVMVERAARFKKLKGYLPCVNNEDIINILNLEDLGNFLDAEEILRDYSEELSEFAELLSLEADRLHDLEHSETEINF